MQMTNATHLNLINRIDDKTGASVGMYRNVNVAPIEWGNFFKVSDDKMPMTGVWYRNTDATWCLAKVVKIGDRTVELATSVGDWAGSFAEFAANWELN
jgi:hypothetical protein